MTGGSDCARLGARLPRSSRANGARAFISVLFAGLFLLGPSGVFAQDDDSETESPTASVRVRAADEAAPDAGSDVSEVSEVAARRVPVAERQARSSGAGETIVAFALHYVGYPYVWAGNTPAGFDCSGFTQFVILNTLGIDIGHDIEGQPGAGTWVDYGAWQPGDLVFFQNTYRAGISHAGLYIGDGLFVHAENEGTGVVVTSISSDYYGPRYWGAVRVG